MRGSGIVAIVLALAACGTQTRVLLEVNAETAPGVDEVRVYLAASGGERMQITPARRSADPTGAAVTALGPLYFLDLPSASDRVTLGASRTARFSYAPGEISADHLTALAVGFKEGTPVAYATAFALSFIADETLLVPLDLYDAGTARRLETWGGDDGQRCAIAELDDTQVVIMVADPDDVDCDGYGNDAPEECDRFVHDAQGVPSTDIEDIVPMVSGDDTRGTCAFPTSLCVDGGANNTPRSTLDNPWCTARSVCNTCAGAPFLCDAEDGIKCVANFEMVSSGRIKFCSDRLPILDGTAEPPLTCRPARLYYDDAPHWRDRRPVLGVPGDEVEAKVHSQGCALSLEVTGETAAFNPGQPFTGALALPIDGAPGAQGVVMPLSISYELVDSCSDSEPLPCAVPGPQEQQLRASLARCLSGL